MVSTLKLTKIQTPNSDSDVISLDTSNGNITLNKTLNVDTIVDKAGSGGTNVKIGNTSTYVSDGGATTQSTVSSVAKSWCRWESIGTASVLDSFNHSSMTDNGTGDQSITIASAMANTTYAHVGMAGGSAGNQAVVMQQQTSHAATTTVQRYQTTYANDTLYDWSSINTALFGDLA